MNALWTDKRIFLIGGPGGVGKTTVAAALGVQLASKGYKTVVLTVDPAKRLAQALGFSGFTSELQKVTIPNHPEATLYASMLDTQRYFDKIISRFAKSDEQREKILHNKLYRIMVESLGGSHEYAAMERLLEFSKDSQFDKIIVDTPPSQNAVDLLNAPQRLADFMDNSVLKWFQTKKPPYLSLFRQGTKVAMKLLEKVFGSEFFEALAKALDNLEGMQAGFKERNLEVMGLLRSEATGFFLVTYPSEARYLESLHFLRVLQENQIPLSGLVLNRLEIPVPEKLEPNETANQNEEALINALLSYHHSIHTQQTQWIDKFRSAMSNLVFFPILKENDDIHELATLSRLGNLMGD